MPTVSIPFPTYRERVLGCWLGKAVGGTLGGPYEGRPGPHALTFYDPVPDRMLPNDDLDLQVVWFGALRRRGLPVDRRLLADAWLEHVHLWPDEYGVAARNLTQGIFPPASGAFDNGFTAGMGSAIRSEIWACLAPGDPKLAAALAREDACVDHHDEGIHSEVYLATLQSAAFLESDREKLLDVAAAAIPDGCRVARAIADTRRWWEESGDWQKVREQIIEHHGRQNFTDVAQNLAFIVLGWLAADEFGPAICTAVNCGRDTDCTGATLGALLGILEPASIGGEWLKPIGRELVLSPGIVGMHPPATLDEFTDQVAAMALDVLHYYGSHVEVTEVPSLAPVRANVAAPRMPKAAPVMLSDPADPRESLVATEPLVVYLRYPEGVALRPGRSAQLELRVVNPSEGALHGKLVARVPDGWLLSRHVPAPGGPATAGDDQLSPQQGRERTEEQLDLPGGKERTVLLTVTPPAAGPRAYRNPLDVTFEFGGFRWTVTAGLVTTLPWRRWSVEERPEACPEMPADAQLVEVPGHFQPLPEGPCAFAADVKIPYPSAIRFVVQAPRPLRVWLDAELINEHDGTYRVPAIHRARHTGSDVQCRRGWHRLTVAVSDGDEGELFVGLGSLNWDWLRNAEWRDPDSGTDYETP
jgi:ADP-ribosylglycohydrolase